MKKNDPSTAVATRPVEGENLPAAIAIPRGMEGAFSPEEWAEMTPAARLAAIEFYKAEEDATTEGSPLTLPRWKFPTSGATRFVLETDAQDPPEEKELAGIIVAKIPGRGYYEPGKAATKGTPPLCASSDGNVPDVSPSPVTGARTCAACPMSQWGSGKDGQGNPTRGQACKYRIRTFFMRGDQPLPEYISLPPTASKPLGQYTVQLVQARTPMIAVETVMGLAKQTSGQGIEFQGLTLRIGRKVSFAESSRAREIASKFETLMRRAAVSADDGDEPHDPSGGQVVDVPVSKPDPKAGF